MVDKCSSCNIEVVNQRGSVSFKCPKCAGTTIFRCPSCRKIAARYRCSKCGFEGPN